MTPYIILGLIAVGMGLSVALVLHREKQHASTSATARSEHGERSFGDAVKQDAEELSKANQRFADELSEANRRFAESAEQLAQSSVESEQGAAQADADKQARQELKQVAEKLGFDVTYLHLKPTKARARTAGSKASTSTAKSKKSQ
jgi:hypothetical protein